MSLYKIKFVNVSGPILCSLFSFYDKYIYGGVAQLARILTEKMKH
ncbi:MAG: hypothetical protein WC278_03475 [Bacilli bacterium]|nr:hypothetical protein [Bacilli bacterium]MDD2682198.1 hypothetical protein [Bacilli bacterium]MDD3121431.1 hypothetical protein [Bacilli bacterium]MDD4063290.1 hypothetical protein [Bacilli bacterium]MDD4482172.1 hypothetical protein [Bacilli bacterium]